MRKTKFAKGAIWEAAGSTTGVRRFVVIGPAEVHNQNTWKRCRCEFVDDTKEPIEQDYSHKHLQEAGVHLGKFES